MPIPHISSKLCPLALAASLGLCSGLSAKSPPSNTTNLGPRNSDTVAHITCSTPSLAVPMHLKVEKSLAKSGKGQGKATKLKSALIKETVTPSKTSKSIAKSGKVIDKITGKIAGKASGKTKLQKHRGPSPSLVRALRHLTLV